MAGETIIAVVGNLTADPEIRTAGSGASVASFTIASTPRTWNRNTNQFEDGQALFMRCSAWRDMAEHCAQSLAKGMRVIAQGRLQQRSYQAQDGSQRTVFELQVDETALPCGMRRRRWPSRSVARLERMGIRLPLRPAIRAGPPLPEHRCRLPTRGVRLRVRRLRSVISASRNPNRISDERNGSWASP